MPLLLLIFNIILSTMDVNGLDFYRTVGTSRASQSMRKKTKKSVLLSKTVLSKDYPITLSARINNIPSPGGGTRHRISKRRIGRHLVPIYTALVIGSFSIFEILETSHKVVEPQLGHAHGIAILALIRLGRSIAILQTQAEEFEEQVQDIEEEIGLDFKQSNSILAAIGRIITAPVATILACLFAVFGSAVEIFYDMKPGAHYGTMLLALSEISNQIRRLRRYKRRDKNQSMENTSLIRCILSKIPLGAMIALSAAGFACFELYEDIQPGAHHGVALLALADLIENINRSNIIRQKRLIRYDNNL